MKPNTLRSFSRRYLAALRIHAGKVPRTVCHPAHDLGMQAAALKLETLDMAGIHEDAMTILTKSAGGGGDFGGWTDAFFAEALTTLEQTRRGASETRANLGRIVMTLGQRSLKLTESVRELEREVIRRKAVEETLLACEESTRLLLEQTQQMQEEQRELSRQLFSAQEDERRKISRELHDVIAQTLTGINLRLAALKGVPATGDKALQEKITSTQRLVEKSVDIVHRFARELRPTALDDLGLIPALRSFIEDFIAETGIRVSLRAFAGIEHLDINRRTVLYRIAQEALTNVARHARTSRAEVGIQRHGDSICMEIKDDGRGFAVEGKPGAKKHNRLGLLGMRERIEMIGGSFSVVSAPGKPTTVRVTFPTPHPLP